MFLIKIAKDRINCITALIIEIYFMLSFTDDSKSINLINK
jgi:hypothetical protein